MAWSWEALVSKEEEEEEEGENILDQCYVKTAYKNAHYATPCLSIQKCYILYQSNNTLTIILCGI